MRVQNRAAIMQRCTSGYMTSSQVCPIMKSTKGHPSFCLALPSPHDKHLGSQKVYRVVRHGDASNMLPSKRQSWRTGHPAWNVQACRPRPQFTNGAHRDSAGPQHPPHGPARHCLRLAYRSLRLSCHLHYYQHHQHHHTHWHNRRYHAPGGRQR